MNDDLNLKQQESSQLVVQPQIRSMVASMGDDLTLKQQDSSQLAVQPQITSMVASIDDDLTLEQQDALCEPYFPTPPPERELLEMLRNVFKLDRFRPAQLDAIRPVLSGKDCFVRMATGSGKSLLWQVNEVHFIIRFYA
jgi:superfamily II DNA helicase RecQ